jgi:hypothetical protein
MALEFIYWTETYIVAKNVIIFHRCLEYVIGSYRNV